MYIIHLLFFPVHFLNAETNTIQTFEAMATNEYRGRTSEYWNRKVQEIREERVTKEAEIESKRSIFEGIRDRPGAYYDNLRKRMSADLDDETYWLDHHFVD